MKQLMLCTFLILFVYESRSQEIQKPYYGYRKAIFAEFRGEMLGVGINFDMRFKKNRMHGFGYRVGIGALETSNKGIGILEVKDVVTFPIEINYVSSKKTFGFKSGVGALSIYTNRNNKEEFLFNSLFFNLGIRYHSMKKSGLMFQLTWNPHIVSGRGFVPAWFALGLGVSFVS